MMPPHCHPRDLEHWMGRQLQLAAIALTAPIMEMHLNLAALYREQIAAIILTGGVADRPVAPAPAGSGR